MKDNIKKSVKKVFSQNHNELKEIISFLDAEILNCIDKLKSPEHTKSIEDVRDAQAVIRAYETTKWLFK